MKIEFDDALGAWLAMQKDAAAFFGVSVQAFQRWGYQPKKVQGRSKYYDVREILDDFESDEDTDPESPIKSLNEERARLAKEQADAAEIKNKTMLGLLIPAEQVAEVLLKVSQEQKSILDALPTRLKNKFPELKAKSIGYVESELARVRNAIADIRVNGDPG